MLFSPIIYYIFELFLFLVLAYDSLGYLVTLHRNGKTTPEEYSRLVFTWIFTMVMCHLDDYVAFLPLVDELFLALKIFLTLPVLNGTNKLKKILIDDKLLCGLCSKFGMGGACGKSSESESAEEKEPTLKKEE